RRGPAPLQAHHREAGSADRTPRPRVLREADRRTQAQEGSRRQAPLQARSQHAAAQEALLRVSGELSSSFPPDRRLAAPDGSRKPARDAVAGFCLSWRLQAADCLGQPPRVARGLAPERPSAAAAPSSIYRSRKSAMSLKQRISDDM